MGLGAKAEGVRPVARGDGLEGGAPILSLREIAPAGFLTQPLPWTGRRAVNHDPLRGEPASARSPWFVRQLSPGIGLIMVMVFTYTSTFAQIDPTGRSAEPPRPPQGRICAAYAASESRASHRSIPAGDRGAGTARHRCGYSSMTCA